MSKKILVKRKFTLQVSSGIFKHFTPGEHEIEDDVAAHPYVKTHEQHGYFSYVEEPTLFDAAPEDEEPAKAKSAGKK